ncbi:MULTISPECIES: DUF58 domain-containing protein [unclassified Cupriavidus]|uniref:DUF58 domain-containing protein n=1 Tax=unclassified Cupriavidus TaxID=2640874 RepID=UPI00313CADAF
MSTSTSPNTSARPRRPRSPGDWLRRSHGPVNGVVTLHRRQLYILPTRGGMAFAVLLLAMLMTSLNYNISLGFALTFLLIGIVMACMWTAYRNLLDLEVGAGAVAPAFVGDAAVFALQVDNRDDTARIGVEARANAARTPRAKLPRGKLSPSAAPSAISTASTVPTEAASLTLDAQASGALALRLPATRRGRLSLPRVTLESRFPFGLFRVWSYADLPLATLVYPAPEAGAPPLPLLARADDAEDGTLSVASDDGIDQLRRYRTGDPLHRIAWKHSARTGRWMSRTGQTPRDPACWLDWHALPDGLDTEARLSRLCAWVLAAGDDLDVGLRLPAVEIPPGHGAAHRRACLEALALWPERPAS